MGRSTSCFKIITCGSDSAGRDDLQLPESKGSSDKRGWSFRKKSARHRVLSNTVISETTPSSVNKDSPESTILNFQQPDIPPAPEKIAVIQCTDEKPQLSEMPQLSEKPQLSASTEQELPETIVVTKDKNEVDDHVEESVVIVIQAAVRVFLAQKELLKLKYVVKLQAAVRGHLVRQHAIGTLRCVQAIVKMQALIRARRARSWEEQVVGKHGNPLSETPQKQNSVIKPTTTYISIEKLLRNSFARQLMKSTPKRKPIRIKCDSSKPNSGWNWLERWMSVSSPEPTPSPDVITEQLEVEKSEIVTSPVQTRAPPERFSELEDTKPNMEEIVLSSESEKNNVISDVPDFKFQVCHPNSPLAGDQVEWLPQPEMISKSDTEETPITIISLPNQTVESEVNSKTVTDSLPCKQELEGEQPDLPRRSLKRGASEQLDTEEKKFVYGSRKSSSPVLIASQAKYEELSSKASLNRSSSFSHQDSGIESNSDISGIDTELRTKELDMTENSVSHISRVQYGSSECGTELSVTSTLDSPDAFEVGAAELEHGAKFSEEETRNPNRTKFLDIKDKDSSKDPVSNLSHVKEPEKLEVIKGESANTIVAADSSREEMNPEISVSDVKRELSSETGGLAYRSSPEASPRSHLTVPGSQGTPSSQLSVKAKKSRADRSSSSQKHKSSSASKRSPSNPNHDSGASSVEQLSKDQKNGKRRNSFGSPKPDSPDQEPRDSSSSSPSLPRFMKATESARAKVNANNSPRSSPDVQDRDFIKKRQSLPGANGRHGSPLIERSTSQAQHGAKGNGSHIAHEKKWQR